MALSRCRCIAGLFLFLLSINSLAQDTIPVEGIADRQVYVDSVPFRVPAQPGFIYLCALDGQPVPVDEWVSVDLANYHELLIQRTNASTGGGATRLLQFIVRSSERNDSEWGLPARTPYPVIYSAPQEFDGIKLQIIAPLNFPAGLEIPIVARLLDDSGRAARLNGAITAPGYETLPFVIRRGFGALRLPPVAQAGTCFFDARLNSLSQRVAIAIETNTSWTSVAGLVTNQSIWPANSRLLVSADWTIASNAIVEIGPGSVLKLSSLANIYVAGRFVTYGSTTNPIVFGPESATRPWGGFVATNPTSSIELTGTMLTGGGADPSFFLTHPGLSHRPEQAVLVVQNGAQAALTNCFLFDLPGQAANGYFSTISLDHCLVQRCQMVGQFEGGNVTVTSSAFLEFPVDSPQFLDADNDAIYFAQGQHVVTDTLIGWAKDDALDAGSGYAGTVTVSNCWLEACYHEGLAWSGGGRVGSAYQTVILNCGQGVEAGFSLTADSPIVLADHVLCLNNAVGARFGDNYVWVYNGWMQLTNSFFLYNSRDVWGMNWQDWAYRAQQMDVRQNYLSAFNPYHPDNSIWNPDQDGGRLAAFRPGSANRPVGLSIALRHRQTNLVELAKGIPVGLSCFSTNWVRVDYRIEDAQQLLGEGTLRFAPGEMVKFINPPALTFTNSSLVHVSISQAVGAEITGLAQFYLVNPGPRPSLPTLRWMRSAEGLILAWPNPAHVLEQADQPAGPWQTMTGFFSPAVVPPDGEPKFFRLRR